MRKFDFTGILRLDSVGGTIYRRLPERSTKNSAGYDFYCPQDVEIPPYKLGDNPTMVKTGIKVKMEDDEFLMLVNRSSNPKKKKLVLANGVGIIDAKVL